MHSACRRRSACAAGSPSCGRSVAPQAGRSPRSRRAARGTRRRRTPPSTRVGERAEAGIAPEGDDVHCQTAPFACSSTSRPSRPSPTPARSAGASRPSGRKPPPRRRRRGRPAARRRLGEFVAPLGSNSAYWAFVTSPRSIQNDGNSTSCAGRSLSYAQRSVEPSVNGPADQDVTARLDLAGLASEPGARRAPGSARSSRRAEARAGRPSRRGTRSAPAPGAARGPLHAPR